MSCVVTGGLGFIGSNLSKALVNASREVIIIDDQSLGVYSNISDILPKVKVHIGDVSAIKDLDIDAPETIFHLGIPSSSPMYRTNPYLVSDAIRGAISILEYAVKKGVSKVIITSTSSIYSNLSPSWEGDIPKVTDYYTEARISIERLAELYNKLYGLKTVCPRLFSVYGPNEGHKYRFANVLTQFIWNINDDVPPTIYGDGIQSRDFIYVSDVVEAFLLAERVASSQHLIFNVGTGISTDFNKVVAIINNCMGKHIEPKYLDVPMKNYIYRTQADTYLSRSLGFNAKVHLVTGIKKTIEAYYPGKYTKFLAGD
jgi:UDP-glucose 4-epimerase